MERWCQYQRGLVLASWVAGVSIAELWGQIINGMAASVLESLDEKPQIKLVTYYGRRIDNE